MFLQYGAVVSTIAVEMVVLTVIVNFFITLIGSGRAIITNLPIRWFYAGMVFYFLTCLGCVFQTTHFFQALIHFTDWVVGHAHMVMFGVFSMWLLGVMTYLFPRLLGVDWYSRTLSEYHFWLSAGGLFVMAADLIMLGSFRDTPGPLFKPWEASVDASYGFWVLRIWAGLSMFLGQVAFLYNLYKTWQISKTVKPVVS